MVEEIASLSETMNLAARRIQEISRHLYEHSRRMGTWDDNTSAYITYANAWSRFSLAIQQGVHRTSSVSKLLDRVMKGPSPLPEPKKEKKKPEAPKNKAFSGAFGDEPSLKDLMDLYKVE